MSEAVIVALITGGLSLVGVIVAQLIISNKTANEMYAKLDKHSELNDQKLAASLEKFQAVTDTKIDNLTAEVHKHNNLVERTYKLEETTAVHTEQIKTLNSRLGVPKTGG